MIKKVLVSNDDGIDSLGLKSLAEKLSQNFDIFVVSTDKNKSTSSHSLSTGVPIKVEEYIGIENCKAYKISGTPSDCVKIARHLISDFDIVVSGINLGQNLSSDILYSGTFAIAEEGAFFDKISFAFSTFNRSENNFSLYSDYALKIVETLIPYSNKGSIWNINFPGTKNIKGVKFSKLGKFVYKDKYEKISDNEYVLKGSLDLSKRDDDCDLEYIKQGYITITPIIFDRTDKVKLNELSDICIKL